MNDEPTTTKGLKNVHRALSLDVHTVGAPPHLRRVRTRRADALPLKTWARQLVRESDHLAPVARRWLVGKGSA